MAQTIVTEVPPQFSELEMFSEQLDLAPNCTGCIDRPATPINDFNGDCEDLEQYLPESLILDQLVG